MWIDNPIRTNSAKAAPLSEERAIECDQSLTTLRKLFEKWDFHQWNGKMKEISLSKGRMWSFVSCEMLWCNGPIRQKLLTAQTEHLSNVGRMLFEENLLSRGCFSSRHSMAAVDFVHRDITHRISAELLVAECTRSIALKTDSEKSSENCCKLEWSSYHGNDRSHPNILALLTAPGHLSTSRDRFRIHVLLWEPTIDYRLPPFQTLECRTIDYSFNSFQGDRDTNCFHIPSQASGGELALFIAPPGMTIKRKR
jgi:hypothetical protein